MNTTIPPGNYCPKCGEVIWCACACTHPKTQLPYAHWIAGNCPDCGEKPPPDALDRAGITVIDYTESGPQYMIPDAPTRKVPATPLRAKRPQTEKLTVLELYETEQKQPKLF